MACVVTERDLGVFQELRKVNIAEAKREKK